MRAINDNEMQAAEREAKASATAYTHKFSIPFEFEGKTYFALVPADEESEEYVILRLGLDEKGEETLVTIDDDEEFDRVADYFEDELFDIIDYDEDGDGQ